MLLVTSPSNSILNGGFANDSYSREQMEKCRKKYRGFALDGIEAGELGVYLYSDFNKNSLMDRDSTKQAQVALAKELIEQYGSVRLLKPNAYLGLLIPSVYIHNILFPLIEFRAVTVEAFPQHQFVKTKDNRFRFRRSMAFRLCSFFGLSSALFPVYVIQ